MIKIQFEIDDDKGDDRLIAALGCKPTELSKALSVYGKAALLEYIEMFRGSTPLRSIVDAREERLLQIILAGSDDDIPREALVARLFHVTRVQARSMLRSVFERKDFDLQEHLRKACVAVLQDVDRSTDPISLTITNPRVYEALNRILTDDGRVPLLMPVPVSVSDYTSDKKSLDVLLKYFKLNG